MLLLLSTCLSIYGMLRDNLTDSVTFLSIVQEKDFIVGPVMFCFMVLLCGITCNGKAAKTHCTLERDNCVAIKLLLLLFLVPLFFYIYYFFFFLFYFFLFLVFLFFLFFLFYFFYFFYFFFFYYFFFNFFFFSFSNLI